MFSNLPKYQQKKIRCFFGKFKTPKRHSEINWPLGSSIWGTFYYFYFVYVTAHCLLTENYADQDREVATGSSMWDFVHFIWSEQHLFPLWQADTENSILWTYKYKVHTRYQLRTRSSWSKRPKSVNLSKNGICMSFKTQKYLYTWNNLALAV